MNVLRRLLPIEDENITWQRIVETFKWAYARRTELGDPDFVKGIGKSTDRDIFFKAIILKTTSNQIYLRMYSIRLISINHLNDNDKKLK